MYHHHRPSSDEFPPAQRLGFTAYLRSIIPGVALMIATGTIAFLLWEHDVVPKQVQRYEITKIDVEGDPQRTITARTRLVFVPSLTRSRPGKISSAKEIQLPDGRWIDCRGDCASAYKNATLQ